jgi:membrane protein DedA with SNARE-associated domain
MVYDMITDFTPIFIVSAISYALGRYIGYNICRRFCS